MPFGGFSGRNQDYPPPFTLVMIHAIFMRRGVKVYEGTTFAGTVGFVTPSCPTLPFNPLPFNLPCYLLTCPLSTCYLLTCHRLATFQHATFQVAVFNLQTFSVLPFKRANGNAGGQAVHRHATQRMGREHQRSGQPGQRDHGGHPCCCRVDGTGWGHLPHLCPHGDGPGHCER